MREELIKILAGISDDYPGTLEKLEEYIYNKASACYWDGAYERDPPKWLIELSKKQ